MTDQSSPKRRTMRSEVATSKREARITARLALREARRAGASLPNSPAVSLAHPDGSALNTRELLRAAQTHTAAGDWAMVARITGDTQATLDCPRLLVFRLMAAKELGDSRLLSDIARVTVMLPNEAREKLYLLRDLAKSGKQALVAKILLADPELRRDPRFFKMVPHVVRGLESRTLRRRFREAVVGASQGGSLVKGSPSPFAFALRSTVSPLLGTVSLASGPRVKGHHLPGLRRQADLFRHGVEKALAQDSQPQLRELHNVFTDRFGQIWTEAGQIIRSKGEPIASVTRKTAPHVKLAMLAHSKTRGIYHWLVDRVPRFAWLNESQNNAGDVVILISDNAPGFERTCLEMLGLADRIVLVGDAVFVERLIVPKMGFRSMAGWTHVDWGITKLIEVSMAKASEEGIDLPSRIYISRGDAKRRQLLNEAAVEDAAVARGFTVHQFSSIPIWHQIALAHSARVVMGPHGAGLAHLIAARHNTKVIEIIPIKDGTYQLRFNYARLSIIKGLDYRGWIEVQDEGADAWTLDVEPFLNFLDSSIARCSDRHPLPEA